MKFIDTHCHLYAEEFDAERIEVQKKALLANVEKIVLPAIDSKSHKQLFDLASSDDCFLPLIGLHPTSVDQNFQREIAVVEDYLSQHNVFGIGEVGIDLYWSEEFKKEQIVAFDYQIQLALKYDLPLVIHSRDAFDEIFDVLESYKGKSLKGIFHAFTGGVAEYERLISLGDFAVGIGGIVTFKNSGLADVVSGISLDRIVLETDAPYLAPTPHRGKRNVPEYIPLIAAKVAEIKGVSLETVGDVTTSNAARIFNM